MATEKVKLPDALDVAYWKQAAGKKLDAEFKVADLIKKVEAETNKVSLKLLDTSRVEEKDYAKRRTEIEKVVLGQINSVEESLKKLEAEAKKAFNEAKKEGKASAVQAILSAVNALRADLDDARDEAKKADDDLKAAIENARKYGGKEDESKEDPKVVALLKKQVERLGAISRKSIRDLQSGKIKKIPFVFGACKEKQPFKPGVEWEKRCLIYLHPKATKASRSVLQKFLLPSPVWAIGEATCPDGKKIVFNCTETPPANIRQLKDALRYQMKNYAPPLRVIKDNKVEGEEAGEGDDDEDLKDDPGELEDDTPTIGAARRGADAKVADSKEEAKVADRKAVEAEKALDEVRRRLTDHSGEMKSVIAQGGPAAKDLRDIADKLNKAIREAKVPDAQKLIKQMEDHLSKAAKSAKTAAADALSPEVTRALKALADARKAATTGASRVAELIRKSYAGDQQEKKAAEGAARLEAANKKLLGHNLEAMLQSQLRSAKGPKLVQVADAVQKIRVAIEKNDLLPDIDKSPFAPSLNVVGPYVNSLKAMESALRAAAR